MCSLNTDDLTEPKTQEIQQQGRKYNKHGMSDEIPCKKGMGRRWAGREGATRRKHPKRDGDSEGNTAEWETRSVASLRHTDKPVLKIQP